LGGFLFGLRDQYGLASVVKTASSKTSMKAPEKETIRLDITKPGTIEIKVVGKTSIPVTTTADLDDIYTLALPIEIMTATSILVVNWIEDKTKMDKTKIFQNDGKGNFKDVTAGEK
jgi:hypothetical protein